MKKENDREQLNSQDEKNFVYVSVSCGFVKLFFLGDKVK